MQKTIVLTFDDACTNHLDFVVPLLKKYGFGATFFVCSREVWGEENAKYFMTGDGFAALHRAGFEIGNHTISHAHLPELNDDGCREEIGRLNEYLASYGIPKPVSFAYPGGPYAPNAVNVIAESGLKCARTTEQGLWDLTGTDPMRVPSYAIAEPHADLFDLAMAKAGEIRNENQAVVLLYHGVPDIAHPWCNTPPEMFEAHMKYLFEQGFQVISMADFMARKAMN